MYHYNPLEYHHVGALAREQKATILVGAPTFLRTYLRRCEQEDFATLNIVIAGAERMPIELMDAFEQKFGVRPVEGYGTTELSPVVSCNVPGNRSVTGKAQIKEGDDRPADARNRGQGGRSRDGRGTLVRIGRACSWCAGPT